MNHENVEMEIFGALFKKKMTLNRCSKMRQTKHSPQNKTESYFSQQKRIWFE